MPLQTALDGMHSGFWRFAAAPDSEDLVATLCRHALAALHGLFSGNRPWERAMISADGDEHLQFSSWLDSPERMPEDFQALATFVAASPGVAHSTLISSGS